MNLYCILGNMAIDGLSFYMHLITLSNIIHSLQRYSTRVNVNSGSRRHAYPRFSARATARATDPTTVSVGCGAATVVAATGSLSGVIPGSGKHLSRNVAIGILTNLRRKSGIFSVSLAFATTERTMSKFAPATVSIPDVIGWSGPQKPFSSKRVRWVST
jgi:hypothetical protein